GDLAFACVTRVNEAFPVDGDPQHRTTRTSPKLNIAVQGDRIDLSVLASCVHELIGWVPRNTLRVVEAICQHPQSVDQIAHVCLIPSAPRSRGAASADQFDGPNGQRDLSLSSI